MAELNCIVVTPEATTLEAKAEFVALPLFDGEAGILPGHSPMIGRLGYGELRIRTAGREQAFYVDGGFVQVADNIVSVLTNRAVPAGDVDADLAREQLAAATKRKTASDEEFELRDRTINQARGQLRVAKRTR
ncbi:MAG: ATP synthase F1 subunit epsilon [Planctomycetaceae bacterium]|nr:ATP synthase F1 subunit epsilon [Planctomycetaceae bacterium]